MRWVRIIGKERERENKTCKGCSRMQERGMNGVRDRNSRRERDRNKRIVRSEKERGLREAWGVVQSKRIVVKCKEERAMNSKEEEKSSRERKVLFLRQGTTGKTLGEKNRERERQLRFVSEFHSNSLLAFSPE